MSLPPTVVGIDIETTALDPASGEIIEVAAIRYDTATNQEVDRFEVLCQPQRPISQETTAITGITQEMVAGKPPFADQIEALQNFLGDDLLFAHNANFDISWLRVHGADLPNAVWDTFVLAATAWPEAESYNLGTLAKQLGLTTLGEHRAAADVALTWQVLQAIRKSLAVSEKIYPKVKHCILASGQSHYLSLFSVKNEESKRSSVERKVVNKPDFKGATPEKIFGRKGMLEKSLPGFGFRPEQLALAQYLHESVASKQSAVIEAGPGIGKTYAYVAAGLLTGGRILISTHTRVLQDQLIEKDIPALLSALSLAKTVAVLKGRRNYICAGQLEKLSEKKTVSIAEAWVALKVLLWLDTGGSGDIERLNLSHQGASVLRRLTSEAATCRPSCGEGHCPYQKARKRAERADITIINHALLLRAGTGEEDLREHYRLLIVDEAHQLEGAALSASESDLTLEHLQPLLRRLGTVVPHEKVASECEALIQEFSALQEKGKNLLGGHTADSRLRLTPTIRRSQTFQSFREAGENWLARVAFLLGLIRSQENIVKKASFTLYKEAVRRLETFRLELESFLRGKSPDRVSWLETSLPEEKVDFRDSTINIEPYLSASLHMIEPTIAISGTLTTAGSFEYIKSRFGLTTWQEASFPGSFDFSRQMEILVVEDGPLPGDKNFDQFVAQVIENISSVTQGRLLGLFTSQASLKEVYGKLTSAINKAKIRIFGQKMSGGRHNIAKRFRDDHSSILLGTSSFWEGFDSPGETLSVLVIPRLPFPHPTEPVIEALSERVGSRSFYEVMIPRMTLRMKQGVGRLIRTHTDRGVVVILDRRVLEKEYGRDLLHSLPPAKIHVVSRAAIAKKVENFFGPETIARWQGKT